LLRVGIFPDELRLGITVGLNALLLIAAYRFARRWASDRIQAALDACLIWYLVQYAAVAGLGVIGVLSGGGIVIAGGAAAGLLLWFSGEAPHVHARLRGTPLLLGAIFVLLAYLFSIVWAGRYASVIANDSLAYQMPAAVQWLQTGHLGVLPVWFFNPANSYSPLAGSTFVAWLMGPMGNDVLARFVEVPALVVLFLGVVQLGRALDGTPAERGANGKSLATAAFLGLGVVCARPFISQTILAKDDLPLAAFLVAAMGALSGERLRDRLGPWRLGVALGLMLATKFTAVFSLPVVLLAIDAPWRAGWRWGKHLTAGSVAGCLFFPWYLRNWVWYGSPVFPFRISVMGMGLFDGPLATLRTDRMSSVRGIVETLTGTYYSVPWALGTVVLLVWAVCLWHGQLARGFAFLRRQDMGGPPMPHAPLVRACLIGPMLAIAIFIVRSPAAEVRFIVPSVAVLMACPAILCDRWPRFAMGAAALIAAVSIGTGFTGAGLMSLVPTAAKALGALIAGAFFLMALNRAGRIAVAVVIFIAMSLWTYVDGHSYLNACRVEAVATWSVPYGQLAAGWDVIREQTEPGCTVAYSNTFQIYPLYGFDLSRHLVYAPTRPGLERLDQLPPMRPVIGEDVPGEVSRVMMAESDPATWLANLKRSGAKYLIIAKQDLGDPTQALRPPELDFVSGGGFELMFENSAVNVYRVDLN
jgi:hypothetical protein